MTHTRRITLLPHDLREYYRFREGIIRTFPINDFERDFSKNWLRRQSSVSHQVKLNETSTQKEYSYQNIRSTVP